MEVYSWENSSLNGSFSMAMLNNQGVTILAISGISLLCLTTGPTGWRIIPLSNWLSLVYPGRGSPVYILWHIMITLISLVYHGNWDNIIFLVAFLTPGPHTLKRSGRAWKLQTKRAKSRARGGGSVKWGRYGECYSNQETHGD